MAFDTEIGRIINLAQNGNSDEEAQKRLSKRLANKDGGPSAQQSTSSWVNWDNMGAQLGQPYQSSKIPMSKLDLMRRDPMIAFGLAFTTIPLIRAPWYIKSTDAKRAAFVDAALRQIYARYILGRSNAFSFGYSAGVKRFEYMNPDWTYIDPADSDFKEQKVWPDEKVDALVWKSFLWLDPRQVKPHWSKDGEFDGIDLTSTGVSGLPGGFFGVNALGQATTGYPITNQIERDKKADIPLDWALWATNEKDSVFGSLYGYPLIGHAYRYWWSYWHKFALSDRAFEKWADPPIVVYHPGQNGVDSEGNLVNYSNVALSIAEQARSGANIAMPSNPVEGMDMRLTSIREWQIEQLESNANFAALIDSFKYLDVLKLRSVLVPEQGLIEGGSGQSSRNVAQVFGEKIEEAQAVRMEEIDFEINRFLIPQLLEANFGPGGATCTKVTTGFDPQDTETMRNIVGGIVNKHGDIPEVDMPKMLTHLGIPLLSHAAIEQRMKDLAAQADQEAKHEIDVLTAQAALKGHKPAGTPSKGGNAGVNAEGKYVQPREVIELDGELDKEETPEIQETDDPSFWRKVALFFSSEERRREEESKRERDELLGEFIKIGDKVTELAEKDPNIHVQVKVPETPITKEVAYRTVVNRDNEGNIISTEKYPIEG